MLGSCIVKIDGTSGWQNDRCPASGGISIGARREPSDANTEKHRKGKQRGEATSRWYKYCATAVESKGKHRAARRRVFRYSGRTTADSRGAVADRRRFASASSAGRRNGAPCPPSSPAAWPASHRVPRTRTLGIIRERWNAPIRRRLAGVATRPNELFSGCISLVFLRVLPIFSPLLAASAPGSFPNSTMATIGEERRQSRCVADSEDPPRQNRRTPRR